MVKVAVVTRHVVNARETDEMIREVGTKHKPFCMMAEVRRKS